MPPQRPQQWGPSQEPSSAKPAAGLQLPTQCACTLEGHTASVLVVRGNAAGAQPACASGHTQYAPAQYTLPPDLVHSTPKCNVVPQVPNGIDLCISDPLHTRALCPLSACGAGTYCMSGSRDRTVRLWNPHRGTLVNTYRGHSGDVRTLAIAADNSKFVSAGEDRHINLWDVATATTIRRLHGHDAAVNAIAHAASESLLVSGSYDATLSFWDLKGRSTRALQTVKVASDAVTAVATGDAPYVFCASTDGALCTLDVRKGAIVTDQLHQPITSLAAPADGVYVLAACTDAKLRLVDRDKGKVLGEYEGHKHESFSVECALLCADAMAAAGSEDGALLLCLMSAMFADRRCCVESCWPGLHSAAASQTGLHMQLHARPASSRLHALHAWCQGQIGKGVLGGCRPGAHVGAGHTDRAEPHRRAHGRCDVHRPARARAHAVPAHKRR